jgi:ribosome-associated translation inhibitor RaiA
MSYLNWNLDIEDEIDAYDPLGSIIIMGDRGEIEEKCTYLDAFFEALIEGNQHLEKGKIIEVDTLVEPDNLVLDYTGNCLLLSYGKQEAIILDTEQYVQDVYNAVKSLVEILDSAAIKAKEQKPKLIKLRNFIQKENDRSLQQF